MRRIVITGLLGVLLFGTALLVVAIGGGGPPPQQPPDIATIDIHHPVVMLKQLGVTGEFVSATASAPGEVATATANGATVRALSCDGTSKITVIAGPGGVASVATTVGSGGNGIPCTDVGRDLAIASGAPASVVAHFTNPNP